MCSPRAAVVFLAALPIVMAADARAQVAHDDEQATYSPLDEVASMAREAASRPAPRQPAPTEPAAADRWLVVSVHDGDTVLCIDADNVQHKVRLVGIDAPEIAQPFGTKSRDGLRALVLRKSVTVHTHGQDRYGRTLGNLEIDGQDVALRMLAAGLAWHFKRFSDDETLAAAEREARAAQRGLWADRAPVPPWEWRETERERKAQSAFPATVPGPR